jgi:polar amino acid transport system substrate-binding protein
MTIFINKNAAAIILLCLLFISRLSIACSLSIGLSSDFPPYHSKSMGKDWEGITVDLALILAEKAGCRLNIIELPWARSIKLLESGDIQLISHFTPTLERAKYTQFLGPHHIEKVAFIANSSISPAADLPALLPQFNGKIGITRGDVFGQQFDQYVLHNELVNTKLVDIRNNRDRVAMLLIGRLDGIFYDEMSAQYLLASEPRLKNKYAVRFTLQGSPVYWGVSYRHVSITLRQALNQAWLAMLEEDMLQAIYQRYGLRGDNQLLADYPVHLLSEKNE